jgi:hypothetical protein
MIPRSCVIRVRPAPAISPVRILPSRAGPGWRGGAAGAGWDGRRGAEPPADGRGRVLVVPGRGAAGAGIDAVFSRERGQCRVPATAATAAGRDASAGGCAALTDARQGRRPLLAGAA